MAELEITDSERAALLEIVARYEWSPLTDQLRVALAAEVRQVGFECYAEDIGWGPTGLGRMLEVRLTGRVNDQLAIT
jgi:hypothetical protein